MYLSNNFLNKLKDFLVNQGDCPILIHSDFCDLEDHECGRMIIRATESVALLSKQTSERHSLDVVVVGDDFTMSIFNFDNWDDAEDFYLKFLKIKVKM